MSLELIKETLKDVRKTFLIALLIFLGIALLTALIMGNHAETLGKLLVDALSQEGIMIHPGGELKVPSEMGKVPDLLGLGDVQVGTLGFAKALLIKNAKASAMGVGLGIIPFLFLPVLVLLINAAIIGAVYQIFTLIPGSSALSYLAAILPHGIFEIPALILGISMGILLCLELTRRIFGTNKTPLLQRIKGILLTYIFVVVPLLVLAALIESFITPSLMVMSL